MEIPCVHIFFCNGKYIPIYYEMKLKNVVYKYSSFSHVDLTG